MNIAGKQIEELEIVTEYYPGWKNPRGKEFGTLLIIKCKDNSS
jgi:hypothetical protein